MRLAFVDGDAVQHGFGFVIIPNEQFCSAFLARILAVHGNMVACTAACAHAPAADAFYKALGRYIDVNNHVNVRNRKERISLCNCAGEPVKQIPLLAISRLNAVFDHADDHFIRNQLALIDKALRRLPERRSLAHLLTEHIAG